MKKLIKPEQTELAYSDELVNALSEGCTGRGCRNGDSADSDIEDDILF